MIGTFVQSFLLAIGPVMTPGPVSAVIVSEGIRRGTVAGLLIATGHALVELFLVAALALGFDRLMSEPLFVVAIAALGGAFLLWMGAKLAWNAVRGLPRLPDVELGPPIERKPGLLSLGLLTTLANPFWYLWWLGAGGAYVATSQGQGWLSLSAFFLGHIAADFGWDMALASLARGGRRWFTNDRYRALLFICGLFLVYQGVRFLWSTPRLLTG
jgi:threonine/homoserine/homoserine lactone efflux protein